MKTQRKKSENKQVPHRNFPVTMIKPWESYAAKKLKTCQSECHGKLAKIIANQMEDMTSHKETFQPSVGPSGHRANNQVYRLSAVHQSSKVSNDVPIHVPAQPSLKTRP